MSRTASHAGSWYSSSSTNHIRLLNFALKGVFCRQKARSRTGQLAGSGRASRLPSCRSQSSHLAVSPTLSLLSCDKRVIYLGAKVMLDTLTLVLQQLGRTKLSIRAICRSLFWPETFWLNPDSDRVFILGPSHHVYLDGCALSRCDTYSTPLGDLPLDQESTSCNSTDQNKLTYCSYSTAESHWQIFGHVFVNRRGRAQYRDAIALCAQDVSRVCCSDARIVYMLIHTIDRKDITIVPILIGAISTAKEKIYGGLLASYLSDPRTLFVISSDFCHW